jgi:uroporphyrinogen decarboxylase
MREGWIASAPRLVRLELRGRSPRFDRAADGCVSLRVRGVDAFLPVGCEVGIRWQMRASRRGIARGDLDVEVGGVVADLCEPEALLVDEIEGEAVRPGWDRAAQVELPVHALAGGRAHLVAEPVPEDRIVAPVQPVIREVEAAPRGRPGVLDPNARPGQRSGLGRVELVAEPPYRERPGRDGMVTDCFQSRTSLRGVEPLLVRACRREPVERTPVWFMRQAGRSLPEYRELRKRYGLFDIVAQPELCAEVTLQPVRRHDVDAAVMFTDIMFPVLGMGVEVELVENVGPVISSPIRTRGDVDRLVVPEPDQSVPTILEAVRLVRGALRDDQAVIGFCGGPFTVAGYLIEGKPSREFATVKAMMYREPETWHGLMEKLTETFARYVAAKARAGADVIQVFDSWVGALSPSDYEEFVAPYSARILAAADVPTIHFGTGTATLLSSMADAGGDVIGLDWRIPLDRGWTEVGEDRGVQGNLDPAVLLGPWERIESETRAILARAGGRPGHVFNLGHGVPPETDPAVLRRLTEFVHEATVEARV